MPCPLIPLQLHTNHLGRCGKNIFAALGVAIATAGPAFGHAADQGFVLLLPTTAYITGGTIAVAATILLLLLLRGNQLTKLLTPVDLRIGANRVSPPAFVPQFASGVLIALILIGLWGPTDPQANLLPLVLWTVWWMALFVIQGLFFDVWKWVNPWPGLHRLIDPNGAGFLRFPTWVSVWPAVFLFAAFQGFVLADVAPNDPDRLAKFALGYWVFTLAGMSVFGRTAWLRHAECFTVLFDLIGKIRILGRDETIKIGFPGWQVFHSAKFDLSHATFVLVTLAAGSFDGLYETFWWLGQMGVNPLEFPGRSAMIWSTTLGLYGAILLLTSVFALAVWCGLALAGPQGPGAGFSKAFIAFAITLLPIAIGYHFAHYFVTFLVQIQVVVANVADPLAQGWNLFGLGATRVKVGFLAVPSTVKVIWLTQAGVVVFSHILAVILCHRTAEIMCRNQKGVLLLQIGLSVLMVAYTVFGLWLLASPRGV